MLPTTRGSTIEAHCFYTFYQIVSNTFCNTADSSASSIYFRNHIFTSRGKYAIDKSKVLLGYAGPHWEQTVIAELDSALNSWVDLLPFHRTYYLPYVLAHIFIRASQFDGIPTVKIRNSLTSPWRCMPITISFKSSSIDPSFRLPINLLLCRSHL
jgi:hypothetical protein